jgi:hypothetical protein
MLNRLWFFFAARSYLSLKHANIIRRRFNQRVQQVSSWRFHALKPTTKERALGPGHHSPSGTMTRQSDASDEWVICLFDFTGKDCHINAIKPGESHGLRCIVHHWLHCVLGADLSGKQQPSSQSRSDRDAQLISRLDFHWLGSGVAMG